MKLGEIQDPPTPIVQRVALSIKQPWASLIVHGLKTIEIRRWSTQRTGLVYIHAGKRPEPSPEAWAHVPRRLRAFSKQVGGLVGRLNLVGCRRYESETEFASDESKHRVPPSWYQPPRMYGFELADAEPIPFEPCLGNLYFFKVDSPNPVEL
jgi:hypothetical protein